MFNKYRVKFKTVIMNYKETLTFRDLVNFHIRHGFYKYKKSSWIYVVFLMMILYSLVAAGRSFSLNQYGFYYPKWYHFIIELIISMPVFRIFRKIRKDQGADGLESLNFNWQLSISWGICSLYNIFLLANAYNINVLKTIIYVLLLIFITGLPLYIRFYRRIVGGVEGPKRNWELERNISAIVPVITGTIVVLWMNLADDIEFLGLLYYYFEYYVPLLTFYFALWCTWYLFIMSYIPLIILKYRPELMDDESKEIAKVYTDKEIVDRIEYLLENENYLLPKRKGKSNKDKLR